MPISQRQTHLGGNKHSTVTDERDQDSFFFCGKPGSHLERMREGGEEEDWPCAEFVHCVSHNSPFPPQNIFLKTS